MGRGTINRKTSYFYCPGKLVNQSTTAAMLMRSRHVATEAGGKMTGKIIGMYVHQHWPYNHPYAARTWTLDDWHGYADGLKKIGYNTVMVWPMLETMPDPPMPSDEANIEKIARVIDLLHDEFGFQVWVAMCPNVGVDNAEAAKATCEKRHFFYCDTRVNPGDPVAMREMMAQREKLLRPLAKIDAMTIIDSDPGGYPGSTNAEFVNLLMEHRKILDRLRPGIELVYWMHVGWQGYCRFYKTGKFSWGTKREQIDVLRRLKKHDPEPWSIANGLAYAKKVGVASRVINFSYGRIEGEPSFPLTNFGGDHAYKGGQEATDRGLMGNAQTHCIQLPNTFAFARGATGKSLDVVDYIRFADDLIPGQGELIVHAWQALSSRNPAKMSVMADAIEQLPGNKLAPGPLKGLLFGDPRRFITDLIMQLRMKAAFETLYAAVEQDSDPRAPLQAFVSAAEAWQRQHGYENAWWWPELQKTLRRLKSASIDVVLDSQLTIKSAPPKDWVGTGYDFTHKMLRDTESYTPRLIAAMKKAATER